MIRCSLEGKSYPSGSKSNRISVCLAYVVAYERLPFAVFRLWPGFRSDA